MSMLDIPGMTITQVPLSGGVDETSPVTSLELADVLSMINFRLTKDGKRIEKRKGLTEEVTDFGQDVYAYQTYYNSSAQYCQVAALEGAIYRKVASGSWANIHSWTGGNLTHPMKLVEVQGKQFFVQENNSRMIHHDGNDYQIGITAPTTLPSATEAYSTTDAPGLNEQLAYADAAAFNAAWTDGDAGNGTSEFVTADPDSKQGPKGVSKYMKFSFTTAAAANLAQRTAVTVGDLGDVYSIETALYIDAIGTKANQMDFCIVVYNGAFKTHLTFDYRGVHIGKGASTGTIKLTDQVKVNKWQRWKFIVDGSDTANPKITAFLDDIEVATAIAFNKPDTTLDSVVVYARGDNSTSSKPKIHLDYLVVAGTSGTVEKLSGTHRYAVTYRRGGNFPCESNPIKSVVGTDTFVGTGLNDLTPGGTYTGPETRIFRVAIDGTGTPDTIKWSDDDGTTWNSETIPVTTTLYLSYGITLTFGATTGHTLTDYWYFTCSVCAGCPTNQSVTLSSIPVSSDPQVTQRVLYRTTSGGTRFFWLATINDNTTTTYKDNHADMELGDELEEDHDILTNGKFCAWWDERLWTSATDIIYYSQTGYPEHFSVTDRYITVKKGDLNDEITGLVPYKDSLYVFRKKSIYAIQKTTYGYGIFLVDNKAGCRAPWSLVEVNNMLMFISDRGIEVFNGESTYPKCLSDPIQRTMDTIDTTKYDYITSVLVPQRYEVWFSIPDRTG
ncbi:MAG: hypothetical protein WC455_18000, partial [Dehalococcoidia bacterium]